MKMKISKEDIDYLKDMLSKYDGANHRIYPEPKMRERNPYQRDYTRILYSSSFRRLQGKMQFLAISSGDFHRNRLTHSIEVSQIARSIAEYLNKKINNKKYTIPTYVVEAASLAHDLGNPPFGHYGEKILNTLTKDIGGYEGNAQTLKILLELERKLPESFGLNLTLRTILSTIKYYNKSENNPKKFIYDNNYTQIDECLKTLDIKPRTIEAQIMDLSDEIAYAAHDLEDALSQRYFNIDDLLYEFERSKYRNAHSKLKEIVEKSKIVAQKCTEPSSDMYNFYLKKEITSNIVHDLIIDIGFIDIYNDYIQKTGTFNKRELGYKSLADLAEGLKMITFNCIKRSDAVQLYEKQGEIIIKKLFEVYLNQNYNKDFDLLPAQFRPTALEMIDRENIEKYLKRHVADYVGGMMDSYALITYEKFFGKGKSELKFDENIYVA